MVRAKVAEAIAKIKNGTLAFKVLNSEGLNSDEEHCPREYRQVFSLERKPGRTERPRYACRQERFTLSSAKTAPARQQLIANLAGLETPDSGSLHIDSLPVSFRSPAEAMKRG